MACKPFSFIKNLSIFQKMILSFVIVIVLPALLSFIISSRTIENLIIAQTYRDTLSSVEVTLNSISSAINELSHASIYVCNDDLIQDFLWELNENESDRDGSTLANRLVLLRKVENVISNVFYTNRINAYVTLIPKTGTFIYTNYTINDNRIREHIKKYTSDYLRQLGSRVNFTGIERNYVEDLVNHSPYVITWVKTVESKKDGNLIGVLIVSVPENEIAGLMISKSFPVKRILLDREMSVIASTQKQWLKMPLSAIYTGDPPVNEKGYITGDINENGQCILSYEKFKGNEWTLIDIKPVSELSGKLHEILDKFFILYLVSILVFIFIAAAIARGISIPLHRLSKTMLETDLNVTTNPVAETGRDEVHILEYNFDVMRRNINLLMKEKVESERKKREAELQALQSQINPHFLFNTLNAVRCAAETDKKEKVSETIIALINLLRMTLVKGEALITLEQEVENLKNYVKILQMRHGTAFEAYFDVPDILKDYRIPKLLLQPLIENSILHGFEGINHMGIIEMTGELEEGRVLIRISDNGKGLEFDPLEYKSDRKSKRFSGIGVANVNERIKIHYGSQYGVEYISKLGKGTDVQVVLPGLFEEKSGYDKDNDR